MPMLRRIIAGCGYVEGYGHHPGTIPLLFFIVLGFVAGGWIGGVISGGVWSIPYFVGAYARGNRA